MKPERHASNLELFLDLIFVFAVTQITSYIAENLTLVGVLKGAMLAALVWWQWTAFVWAGSAVDFQSRPRERVVVLAMLPATLLMAVTVPYALTTQPFWFAGSYAAIQLLVLLLQGLDAFSSPTTRPAFIRYAPLAAIAPACLLVGSAFHGTARVAVYAGVVLIDILSALAGGRDTTASSPTSDAGPQWRIEPVHFAERHALIVIISLGEVLVAIGATTAGRAGTTGLTAITAAALAATVGAASMHWWSYFAYVPTIIEHALASVPNTARGRVARDYCSFGHFPLVFGVILYAVVAKHVMLHPTDPLPPADRWLLAASCVLFIGAFMHIQWRSVRRVSSVRVSAVVGGIALAVLATWVGGVIIVALYAVVLAVAATLNHRSFLQSDLGRRLRNEAEPSVFD